MTREEEMWEAVEKEHGVLSRREAFITITAMEWADKTMIEKAFEWLCANMVDNTYLGANTLIALKKAEFIQKFKKAMEE